MDARFFFSGDNRAARAQSYRLLCFIKMTVRATPTFLKSYCGRVQNFLKVSKEIRVSGRFCWVLHMC